MTVALDFETRLRAAYERHFTRHKRQPTRALGWPATLWLIEALNRWNAQSVLEAGSGWSTTALRLWQAEGPWRVVTTTDHKPAWLAVAEREVMLEGLNVNGFVPHDRLSRDLLFDVVLCDLADTPTRLKALDEFIGWTKPGGWLVLDDWHVPAYRTGVLDVCRALHLPAPEPVLASTDEWGRHLAVWRRP